MKFTLSWLKDHLDTNATLQEIGDTLTMLGLEVESITDRAEALKVFTVAKILHAEKHPEADKLRVCRVQSDAGELQIVCGAPNARTGIYVALAKEGAVIPGNGMVIKKSKIRGVESQGMLCSADELALGGVSDGIIELPELPIGTLVANALGVNDPVIDIAITPNRADCLGVRGIARDLAAAGLGTLKALPELPAHTGGFASPIQVSIENTASCPQFIGAYVKNVKNGPSPEWMQQRLEAIGQKPISALVDITNYITFDLGRPLHVFDTAHVQGNIHVRSAKADEPIKALNGKEYRLQPGMTVIADAHSALAIGGIIGGEASGCTENTQNVFLEAALFAPEHIAQTGRALAIDSDARYRFERGVDVDFVETGARIALDYIQRYCGGTASELVLAGSTPAWQRSFHVRASRIETLGGVAMERTQVEAVLKALGFSISGAPDGWTVSPPSWRSDIDGEADIVEELLRIHGYNHIPETPLPVPPSINAPAQPMLSARAGTSRRVLASRGLLETYSWSFLSQAMAVRFGGGQAALQLLNPISADLDSMRPSLLPNLLDAVKRNAARGFHDTALFETGLQFHDITPDGQRMIAAGLRCGNVTQQHYNGTLFSQDRRPVDAFDVKADALAVLQALGLAKFDITKNVPNWYHPGRAGAITLGGKIILGYFGELHPGLLRDSGIDGCVAGFEIFLDALPASRAKGKAKPTLKLSDYQAVTRDFAFIVDNNITAFDIEKALRQAEKQLITDIAIFDVYTGKGVEEGKKSVAVNITLQAPDRTLSEQDISNVSAAITAAAEKSFGGLLRQ